MFKTVRLKGILERKAESELFSVVGDELSQGVKNNGLWIKAKSEAMGDAGKAEAIYIKLRVNELRDDISLPSLLGEVETKDVEKDRQAVEIKIEDIPVQIATAIKEKGKYASIENKEIVIRPIDKQGIFSKIFIGSYDEVYSSISELTLEYEI